MLTSSTAHCKHPLIDCTKSSLINAVQGMDGNTMIFYVDTTENPDKCCIRQYVANPGPEKMKARNYMGPDMVMNQQGQNYTTKSSDLAVCSYMERGQVHTVSYCPKPGSSYPVLIASQMRMYYIGTDGKLKELCRDSNMMDNTGAWMDGDLNRANMECAMDSPVSCCYDTTNMQMKVFFYAPRGRFPCVAFQEDGKWVCRPISR